MNWKNCVSHKDFPGDTLVQVSTFLKSLLGHPDMQFNVCIMNVIIILEGFCKCISLRKVSFNEGALSFGSELA